jgi:hypothetical protein
VDFSQIPLEEYECYDKSDKKHINALNDDVQQALYEMRDLVYVAFTLVDSHQLLDKRVEDVLAFLQVQSQLLWDDVVHAEASKMDVAATYVGSGIKTAKTRGDAAVRVGPDVLGSSQQTELADRVLIRTVILHNSI